MIRHRIRPALLASALLVLAALALPGAAAGFQTVTIENGTLRIVGDRGKEPDRVTITYDSVKDEYVIGHDIDMLTAPPGCTFEGLGPPYNVLHCPAKGIGRINVSLGNGKDSFQTRNVIYYVGFGAPKSFLPPDLVGVDVSYGPGDDVMDQEMPVPPSAPRIGWLVAGGTNPAIENVDMGTGNDKAIVEGAANTVVFGGTGKFTSAEGDSTVSFAGAGNVTVGNGNNTITLGPGNSKVAVGSGTNTITIGEGSSTVTTGGGANLVTFGPGNGVFTGGEGNDTVRFGAGNNTFSGGGGNDSAVLGPGNDSATGGAGADTVRGGPNRDSIRGGAGNDALFGGPGNDRLFGGPDFDMLKGGPGHRDYCLGGGPSALFGCEKP